MCLIKIWTNVNGLRVARSVQLFVANELVLILRFSERNRLSVQCFVMISLETHYALATKWISLIFDLRKLTLLTHIRTFMVVSAVRSVGQTIGCATSSDISCHHRHPCNTNRWMRNWKWNKSFAARTMHSANWIWFHRWRRASEWQIFHFRTASQCIGRCTICWANL